MGIGILEAPKWAIGTSPEAPLGLEVVVSATWPFLAGLTLDAPSELGKITRAQLRFAAKLTRIRHFHHATVCWTASLAAMRRGTK